MKFHYKIFSMRLNDDTIKLLKTEKAKSGLSWNLFIYKILKFYIDKNRE